MPIALLVGPFAALIGVVAIFFVLRRKSVDKRSMYSARRSQIEHKVRAARQRTLAPQSRAEKAPEAPPEVAPTSIFAPAQAPPQVTYEPSAYEAPPAAPAPAVKEAPAASPWDVGSPAAPPSEFSVTETAAAPEPPPFAPPAPSDEAWTPAPAAQPPPTPTEPVWTPEPGPPEPQAPVEPVQPAKPAAAPTAWSVVSEAKESAETGVAQPKKKGKKDAASASWQLASGDAPGMEADDVVKTPSPLIAIAQYAILVVGLVMVLIGVFVMIANSKVT
jgi:hypothetical protein